MSKRMGSLLGNNGFLEFNDNFSILKKAGIQADYNLNYKYNREEYKKIKKSFEKMVEDLKKIRMVSK